MRRVACFGPSLVKLDIRQESERHSDVLDGITRYLSLGVYNEWTEPKKIEFLTNELNNKRPLINLDTFMRSPECTDEMREILRTIQVIKDNCHADCFGE